MPLNIGFIADLADVFEIECQVFEIAVQLHEIDLELIDAVNTVDRVDENYLFAVYSFQQIDVAAVECSVNLDKRFE
jgi:hypothetical protein